MAKTWTQVLLSRDNVQQTCWIETEYAHKGWLVSVEDDPSVVWKVTDTYSEMTSEKLKDHKKALRVFSKKAEAKNI